MSTPNIMQNLMSGQTGNANKGLTNLGMPVMNNQGSVSGTPVTGSRSGASPTSGGITPTPGMVPPGTPNPLQPGGTIASSGVGVNPVVGQTNMSGTGITANTAATPTGTTPTNSTDPTSTGNPFDSLDANGQSRLMKQLTDIYGGGEGRLLDSLLGSIGSNDDSYMQAYEKAMAGPNAENLATLNTTLGNSGVSMDSSTAAIANADFQSNITSQEGLQEQQLKMNDLSQYMSLVQGLQGESAKEVSSGGVMSIIGGIIGAVPGLGSVGKALGGINSTGGQNAANVASATQQSQDSISAAGQSANIPLESPDTSTLGGIDDSTMADLIGADVFI